MKRHGNSRLAGTPFVLLLETGFAEANRTAYAAIETEVKRRGGSLQPIEYGVAFTHGKLPGIRDVIDYWHPDGIIADCCGSSRTFPHAQVDPQQAHDLRVDGGRHRLALGEAGQQQQRNLLVHAQRPQEFLEVQRVHEQPVRAFRRRQRAAGRSDQVEAAARRERVSRCRVGVSGLAWTGGSGRFCVFRPRRVAFAEAVWCFRRE